MDIDQQEQARFYFSATVRSILFVFPTLSILLTCSYEVDQARSNSSLRGLLHSALLQQQLDSLRLRVSQLWSAFMCVKGRTSLVRPFTQSTVAGVYLWKGPLRNIAHGYVPCGIEFARGEYVAT